MAGILISDWAKSISLQTDEEGHQDYTGIFQVKTGLGEGPESALYAIGMPLPGSLYPGNPYAMYRRRGQARLADENKSNRVYNCEIVWTTRPGKRCCTESFTDPLLEPYKLRGGFNSVTKETRVDADGDAILNSAKEPITGIQKNENRQVLYLEMNVAWLDVGFMSEYVDAVNDDEWWGCEARTLRCRPFTWERLILGTCFQYYHCAFEFEYKADGWDDKVLDHGNMVWDAATSSYRRAKDAYEETCHVLLDGNGNATTTATFLDPTPQILAEKDFSLPGWPAVLF
jgi:hypothetical protein